MFTSEIHIGLKKCLSEEEIAALWKIDQRDELKEYFLSTKSDIKWFFPLKLLGYFLPANAPSALENEKGAFWIPQWPVLPYLKKIAEQVESLAPDLRDRYCRELLEIIRGVSLARQLALKEDQQNIRLDNYRTWYFFVQILECLANEHISLDTLAYLDVWLVSRFDTTLPGSEIIKRLLPKFLSSAESQDISKAELITAAVTSLSWHQVPESKRHFGERERPTLAVDSYWLVDSFVGSGNAIKLGGSCSSEFLILIADRLHEVLRREKPHSFRIDFDDKDTHALLRLTWSARDVGRCELGPHEHGEDKTQFDWNSFKPEHEFSIVMNDKQRTVEEIFNNISEKISPDVAIKNRERIKSFVETLSDDYSYIWYRSLLSNKAESGDHSKETLTVILRDLLLGKAGANVGQCKTILMDLVSERYGFSLFKRLAIYVIGKNWSTMSELFWQFNSESSDGFFESSYYEPETYQLLSENAQGLSAHDKEKIKEIIEAGPRDQPEDEHKERRSLLWRQKWYGSLQQDPEFHQLYSQCFAASGTEVKLMFREPMVRCGPGPTPLTSDEIIAMSNEELANYIPQFENIERRSWDEPTPEALAMAIKGVAVESPGKFTSNFSPFSNTGYRYIYKIFFGIREASEKHGTPLDWEKLSEFILSYTNRDEFWRDELPKNTSDHFSANHLWVVGVSAELIRHVAQSDTSLSPSVIDRLVHVIHVFLERLQPKYDADEIRDPVALSLNSAPGKTLEALLVLSLLVAKENKNANRQPLWRNDLKFDYERSLDRSFLEAHEILGRYLINFWFLDEVWAVERVARYGSITDDRWYAFIAGHLHSYVYDQVFPFMETHYRRALTVEFKEDRSGDALVQHVGIAYLRSYKGQGLDSDNSLIRLLISNDRQEQIKRLIGFMWMLRADSPRQKPKTVTVEVKSGGPNPVVVEKGSPEDEKEGKLIPDMDKKILSLWGFLLEKYQQKKELDDSDKSIIADLGKLSVFIKELNDENVKWIMASAEYLGRDFGSAFVIEYLDRLKITGDLGRNAAYIADIFIVMLRSFTPDFREEHIQSLIDFVFSSGNEESRRKAAGICNTYAERKNLILRAVYEKHAMRLA